MQVALKTPLREVLVEIPPLHDQGGITTYHREGEERPRFFLPIPVLRKLFRGKLLAGLAAAFREGRLAVPGALAPLKPEAAFRVFLRSLYRQTWVVYAKPPFGSPAHVLHYLARYTHRVAISNHRLVNVTDETVSFRWKDYRHPVRCGR